TATTKPAEAPASAERADQTVAKQTGEVAPTRAQAQVTRSVAKQAEEKPQADAATPKTEERQGKADAAPAQSSVEALKESRKPTEEKATNGEAGRSQAAASPAPQLESQQEQATAKRAPNDPREVRRRQLAQ